MMLTILSTIEHPERPDRQQLEQLLLQTAAGDREAFSALYGTTRAAVYALTLSILKQADDAQDATQDAFVRIWENAGSYRPQGSPMAWILTIARNLALSRLRQKSKLAELEDWEWDAIPTSREDIGPEDRHVLQKAMAALNDAERQVILLHAVSGMKHREIARVLELPLATVLSKYHRALKKLKNQLEGDDIR